MNKIKPIIIFCLLLLGMAYLPYVPIYILKINIDALSPLVKVIYNLMCNIIFMTILFVLYKDRIIEEFKSYFSKFDKNFELSFKYYFLGLLFMVISNVIIAIFFKGASAGNEETVRSLVKLYPAYMIFSVAIYAPFVEETIFRRSIKDAILSFGDNKLTKYLYIFISGLIFASLHIISSATSIVDYLYIVPYLSLGIAFAALYYRTDNLFSTIIMHSLHNLTAVILYILVGVV